MPLETSEWFRSVSRPIYWIWMGWKNDAKKVAERPVVAEYDGIEYQMRILACVFFWYVIFIPTPSWFKWHQMQYKCNRTTPRPRGQKRPILWMSHAQLPNVGRAQSQCKTVFWCSKVKHSDTYIYIYIYMISLRRSRWFTLMTSKSRNHNIQKHIQNHVLRPRFCQLKSSDIFWPKFWLQMWTQDRQHGKWSPCWTAACSILQCREET